MMVLYLLGLIVPFFSFLLQVWPRLINRYFGIDTWRHLMYARYFRKNKRLPEVIRDRYIVTAPYGYPPFIVILLSLLPEKLAEKYQFLISPLFDFAHNYLIFLCAFYLTQDITVAIISQIVAAAIPIVVIEASNLNTRIVSYLIFSVSFFSLLVFNLSGGYWWIIVSFLTLFILFFTHRFAIQAYFFSIVSFSVLEKDPFYLLFFITTFIIVYFVGGKLYRSILDEHIAVLKFWYENIDYRFSHQFRGNPKKDDNTDFIFRIYRISVKNPYFYMLGNNPWLGVYIGISIFLFFNSMPTLVLPEVWLTKLHIWLITSLVCSLLILAVKKLRFIGEGHRYLEYAIFPLAILVAVYLQSIFVYFGMASWIIFVVSVIGVVISIITLQHKVVVLDRARTISKEMWDTINLLNKKYGKRVRIAVFPFSLGDAMMYFLKGKVLTTDGIFGLLKMPDLFPMVRKPMFELVKKYNLNFIFFDRRYVELKELKLKKYHILIDVGDYVLLKVSK